jgi:uncharacterized protein with FMN-binding domain
MRRALLAIFGTIAGLVGLLSFKTHTTPVATVPAAVATTVPSASPSSAAPAPTSTGSASSATPSPSATASPSAAATTAAATKTVTGDSIDTRWGPVQVKITVSNGKITSATAVDYPENNPRDEEINATAIPTLQQESIGQTTSKIDMVSGATYTSEGYIQSLQSALDKV